MLSLNPNDNQGIRYVLLSILLEQKNLEAAQKILDKYHKEKTAFMSFDRLLSAILKGENQQTIKKLYIEADKFNNNVVEYILSYKKIPAQLQDMYSFGGEAEAIIYAEQSQRAWNEALEVLQNLYDNKFSTKTN
jgi:hypothetical protein